MKHFQLCLAPLLYNDFGSKVWSKCTYKSQSSLVIVLPPTQRGETISEKVTTKVFKKCFSFVHLHQMVKLIQKQTPLMVRIFVLTCLF